MLNNEEIKRRADECKLDPSDVERDYIQSWIIKEISDDPYLGPQLTLKGSGALRKLYYPETRFARDLDFSSHTHLSKEYLKNRLREVGLSIEKQTGVTFIEEVKVQDKKLPEEMHVDALEARMYFKGIFSDGKFDLKTQVDVTRGESFNLPPQYRTIIHPYFDQDLFADTKVRCQKLEEIIATKFITLMHRRRAGDFFDLVYTTFISTANEINRGQVIRVLLAKTDFARSFEQTRSHYCNFPTHATYSGTWSTLLVPAQSAMTFDVARESFSTAIVVFFDEVAIHLNSLARRYPRTSTFSDVFREKIISAGKQNKLIKITYGESARMMEPYKLEYYTRESDGETNEYFWGFDLSGGTSNTVSTKRLICEKIQNVEETEEVFNPQWEIEL